MKDGQHVEQGQVLVEWDPYTFSILTEEAGEVRFKDIIEGVTVHEEVDEVTGLSRYIIVDSPDEKKQPAIEIRKTDGKTSLRKYHMPSHAHLMVSDGETVEAGHVLAKIPRETTKTKDITGGLPRVVELFEARKPRETAVISRDRRHRQARRRSSRGSARSSSCPTSRAPSSASTRCRAACTSTCRKASASARASR